MIKVRVVDESEAARWDSYVASKRLSHHSHAWAWRDIIGSTFRHEPYYLMAEELEADSTLTKGVLPLFYVKSVLFGKALISVPYLNGGGAVACSSESERVLLDYARELGRRLGVGYVELRNREKEIACGEHFVERSHKAAMILPLQIPAEAVFNGFPSKLRSQIRRPAKSGVTSEVVSGNNVTPKDIDNFYAVFSENMRDLGTPVYPKMLFASVCKIFGSRVSIINVYHSKRAIASGITIGHGQSVEIPWASSLRQLNHLSANMLLYWEAIKNACEQGNAAFDFGRSSFDSGTFRFKQQWGCSPLALHWYYDAEFKKVPDINPNSRKFETVVWCWSKLPLGLTNALGPWLTRSLP